MARRKLPKKDLSERIVFVSYKSVINLHFVTGSHIQLRLLSTIKAHTISRVYFIHSSLFFTIINAFFFREPYSQCTSHENLIMRHCAVSQIMEMSVRADIAKSRCPIVNSSLCE